MIPSGAARWCLSLIHIYRTGRAVQFPPLAAVGVFCAVGHLAGEHGLIAVLEADGETFDLHHINDGDGWHSNRLDGGNIHSAADEGCRYFLSVHIDRIAETAQVHLAVLNDAAGHGEAAVFVYIHRTAVCPGGAVFNRSAVHHKEAALLNKYRPAVIVGSATAGDAAVHHELMPLPARGTAAYKA